MKIIMTLVLCSLMATSSWNCSSSDSTNHTDGSSSDGDEKSAKFRVGLVPDTGRIDDNTFNQSAYEGGMRAVRELGIQFDYATSQDQPQYGDAIDSFAKQGYDMIIPVGFMLEEIALKKAAEYPKVKVAIVDVNVEKDDAANNLTGLIFKEDQSGYLAGIVAGKMTTKKKVGVIGGMEINTVKRFCNAFKVAAMAVCPDCKVEIIYTGDFVDKEKGEAAAKELIAKGTDVIFGVGGGMGSAGILYAAQQDQWVIGVDTDEFLTTFKNGNETSSNKILTSAMKAIDEAVFSAIKAAKEGTLKNGNIVYSASNNGIKLAPYHMAENEIPEEVKTLVQQTFDQLAQGTLDTGVDENGDITPPAAK